MVMAGYSGSETIIQYILGKHRIEPGEGEEMSSELASKLSESMKTDMYPPLMLHVCRLIGMIRLTPLEIDDICDFVEAPEDKKIIAEVLEPAKREATSTSIKAIAFRLLVSIFDDHRTLLNPAQRPKTMKETPLAILVERTIENAGLRSQIYRLVKCIRAERSE